MFENAELLPCAPTAEIHATFQADLGELVDRAKAFLERYGTPAVLGPDLARTLGEGSGEQRLARLAAACGFHGDEPGFTAAVVAALAAPPEDGWRGIAIGGVKLPYFFLLAMQEAVEPGEDLVDVTSVSQLEALLARSVPAVEREAMQEVLDRYPVRLSRHTIRQLRLSDAVARQYLPFVDELNPDGLVHTWVGQFHSGIIERMYANRVIFVLHMSCPVYCRFCFRKHKECRQEKTPTRSEVRRGVDYIRSHPEVKEVVLTGGDPFMNRVTLCCAIDGLLAVDHIETLRLATRSLSYHPALFTQRDRFWMRYLKRVGAAAARRGKRIEVATHFIHPDELSPVSLELIAELVSSGIAVYVQTPLLGGVNDRGPELAELYSRLRSAGAEMHYVFMPCSPLQGNQAYASTIDDGLRLASTLRAQVSDRAMPHFCTATSIGKIDWGSNGWVVEEDANDPRYVWLRTPYTEKLFRSFAQGFELDPGVRSNAGGTLDARFMVGLGDRRWVRGGHRPAVARQGPALNGPKVARFLAGVEESARRITTGEATALRVVHRTRAELDLAAPASELRRVEEELAGRHAVTDVVLWSSGRDPLSAPQRLARAIDRLDRLSQVSSVRIRSALLRSATEGVPDESLEILIDRNRLCVANPLRVEVELNLLHAAEIRDQHRPVLARLKQHGVTVYTVTPLLAGVNDTPADILALSSACRRVGIEFHHLVAAGMPLQTQWNAGRPIGIGVVEEIASELRRRCSGRELPRHVVITSHGEVELGLNAEPVAAADSGTVLLRIPWSSELVEVTGLSM